jgi:hypothetical protein
LKAFDDRQTIADKLYAAAFTAMGDAVPDTFFILLWTPGKGMQDPAENIHF